MIFDDLTDARLLVEVAGRLSFAEAGRRLGMPAATVSRRIARLEEAARARLFERTTRSVSVTEAGRLLVGHASRMLDEADTAAASLEAMNTEPRGRVRIAAPVVLGQALLGPVIEAFVTAHPQCDLFADLTNRQVDIVEEGYDLALRVREPGHADLIVRRLGTATTGLFASKRINNTAYEAPADLEKRPFGITLPSDQHTSSITLTHRSGACETIEVDCRLTTTSPWLLMDAMKDDDIVAVLPRIAAKEKIREGEIKPVLSDWHVHQVEVFAVWTSQRLMRPSVRAFVDLAVPRLTDALL